MGLETMTFNFGKIMAISTIKFFAENLPPVADSITCFELNVNDIEKIDCAGVQFIYSVCKFAQRNNIQIKWSSLSEPFKTAMQNLGMEENLFPKA